MNGAIYVEGSNNSKLAGSKPIDSTYISIERTCPTTCPLRKEGSCYGKNGCVGMHARRLDNEADGLSTIQLAMAEAKAIDNAYKGKSIPNKRDLRLHVCGDSRSICGTRVIAKAVSRWIERGGGKCFSYTHAWKYVPREEWGQVSILASIDNVEQAEGARNKGYVPALVVAEHKSNKPYYIEGSDIKWIPCPQQVKNIHCSDCGLCAKANDLYKKNVGIVFAAHGARKNIIKRRLDVIND